MQCATLSHGKREQTEIRLGLARVFLLIEQAQKKNDTLRTACHSLKIYIDISYNIRYNNGMNRCAERFPEPKRIAVRCGSFFYVVFNCF